MKQPADAVEAEVGDVLRDRIAIAQPLFDRLEVPVAELVPSECVTGVDGVLEDEVFDAIGDVLRRRGQPGEDPAVLEVPASLQCSGRFTRWRAGRAEHESCRVPQLVAEAAIALDAALV